MGKHRRQETNNANRAVAAASAAVASATLMVPVAAATDFNLPNLPFAVELPNLPLAPQAPALPELPTVEVPGLSDNVLAAVDAARNVPGVADVESVNGFLNNVEAHFTPAAQGATYSAPAGSAPEPAPAPAVDKGQQIVDIARSKIGAPYVYGAAGPNAFDCSGFTSWVYAQAGIAIPRTSYAQASAGYRVPLDQLQPGDIVAYYGGASHVGIYAGNGQIIDALNSGIPVGYRSLHMMPVHSAFRFY